MKPESKQKLNTAIFVLVATIINVFLIILFLIIGFVLLAKFGNPEADSANSIWIMVIFASSLGLSWVIYHYAMKAFTKKVNVDENFAPLLGSKRPSNRRPNVKE